MEIKITLTPKQLALLKSNVAVDEKRCMKWIEFSRAELLKCEPDKKEIIEENIEFLDKVCFDLHQIYLELCSAKIINN